MIRTKETYRYTDIPEVCVRVKRDLLVWQKRPTNAYAYLRHAQVSKETCYMAKETCLCGNRGLLIVANLITGPTACGAVGVTAARDALSCVLFLDICLVREHMCSLTRYMYV